MRTYPAGVKVQLTIPFRDLNGDPVAPSTVRVRVLDAAGVEMTPYQSLTFDAGDVEMDVEVPASVNALASGMARDIRVVELEMVTGDGTYHARQRYALAASQGLVILKNSFQTYEQALLEIMEMPRLDGWIAAQEADHVAAMCEGFFRLTRIGYRIAHFTASDMPPAGADFWTDELIPPRYWPHMTEQRFFSDRYTERFRQALRRAQIAEANQILQGDPVKRRRQSGVMSESVGESSMFFRPGKPLMLGVSEEALQYLTGYLDMKLTTTRS